MGFMQGKRALIVGIASHRSIAWGIAEAMHKQGAQLAFTYQNDKLKSRVEEAAQEFGSNIVLPCDVGVDAEIDTVVNELGKHWDGLDTLVHSVGFAPREALDGGFLDGLNRENFRIAHDISSYSLAALAKAFRPMMQGRNGSILTLSYLGAERALVNYNVMGWPGQPRSLRALSGLEPGPGRHPRQRHFGWPDQDPRGSGHRQFPQDVEPRRRERADSSHRDHRRRRQCRRLPVFGPSGRHHRRNHLRRRRLQHPGHDRDRRLIGHPAEPLGSA